MGVAHVPIYNFQHKILIRSSLDNKLNNNELLWRLTNGYDLWGYDVNKRPTYYKPHFTNLLVVWNYFKHYFGLGLLYQTPMTVAFSCNLISDSDHIHYCETSPERLDLDHQPVFLFTLYTL